MSSQSSARKHNKHVDSQSFIFVVVIDLVVAVTVVVVVQIN